MAADPISDSRARYLGTKPIKLMKVHVKGQPAMVALSSRPWLCYNYMAKYHMAPLSYDPIEFASSFSSEQCTEGMVGIMHAKGDSESKFDLPLNYPLRKSDFPI